MVGVLGEEEEEEVVATVVDGNDCGTKGGRKEDDLLDQPGNLELGWRLWKHLELNGSAQMGNLIRHVTAGSGVRYLLS